MLSIALSLFLLMDPIGNIPFYISFLQGIKPSRQKWIIFRELFIALIIIILFNFIGGAMMRFLNVHPSTVQIGGGIILFLLCLKMVFPHSRDLDERVSHKEMEPLVVPLAIPLVAGPGVLAAVMIYANQASAYSMVGAILIAWIASLGILISAPWLQKVLGPRGIIAMERLMGLILILIAIEMFLNGVQKFISYYYT